MVKIQAIILVFQKRYYKDRLIKEYPLIITNSLDSSVILWDEQYQDENNVPTYDCCVYRCHILFGQ